MQKRKKGRKEMASQNKPLIRSRASWDLTTYPEYIRQSALTDDAACFGPWNATGVVSMNGFVLKAILEFLKKDKSDIALIRVGTGAYATETKRDDGKILLSYANDKGQLQSALVTPGTSRYEPIPELGNSSDGFDTSSILMLYLMIASEEDSSGMVSGAISRCQEEKSKGNQIPIDALLILNDAVVSGLNTEMLKCKVTGGNVDLLSKTRVQSGGLTGELLCGVSRFLMPGSASVLKKCPTTIGEAKNLVEPYTSTLNWSEEEQMLIPQFDDSFKVPEEVWDMIDDFIGTRGKRLPFNNFGWRGTSGYGKSTGVRIMACILNTPLYVMSCHSTMETQDFLSKFVPSTTPQIDVSRLPSFEDMYMDPDGSYFRITGVFKEGVSMEEVQQAYNDAISSKATSSGSSIYFKLVESDFVKALRTGAIVEMQEYNVIRDSGVLKGLNAYDEPGSVIPLVNGKFVRRHPNAITVWTANVGYASSREEEWSVSRRIRTFADRFELPKKTAIERILYNIENELEESVVEQMYDIWNCIRVYCKEQQIHTDLSLVSLENWCSCVARHGIEFLEHYCRCCVISQSTTDEETQDLIATAVAKPELDKLCL